ncbi:2-oxoglutarate dehydrogenase E1 subunit family protein, partial [Plantibacter sp. CFBP 13570]
MTGVGADDGATNEFGANEWLVDEMYEQYLVDKDSVDRSWWPILEHYRPVNGAAQGTTGGQSDDDAAAAGATASAPTPAAADEAAA